GGGNAAGGNTPNECYVTISRDGSVAAETSTQDLGTGQRTVTAIVVAEILGLEPGDVHTTIGESNLGHSTGSGGSTTCPSQAPAALRGAQAALEDLFKKVGPRVGSEPAQLAVAPGKVVDTKTQKSWGWKEFCGRRGMEHAQGKGDWSANMGAQNPNVSSGQVGGVQTA